MKPLEEEGLREVQSPSKERELVLPPIQKQKQGEFLVG